MRRSPRSSGGVLRAVLECEALIVLVVVWAVV
jgi:hypothetical protein